LPFVFGGSAVAKSTCDFERAAGRVFAHVDPRLVAAAARILRGYGG